jgi:hypothetical protein
MKRLALIVAAIAAMVWLILLAINAAGGCYPWSPKDVEFHQGMTLCPGQTAHIELPQPPPPPQPRS